MPPRSKVSRVIRFNPEGSYIVAGRRMTGFAWQEEPLAVSTSSCALQVLPKRVPVEDPCGQTTIRLKLLISLPPRAEFDALCRWTRRSGCRRRR